jgi:hypothetical protein
MTKDAQAVLKVHGFEVVNYFPNLREYNYG